LAKNDRLDARLLADFGPSIEPRLTPPTHALEKQIGELFTLSRLLIEQRTAVSHQLEHFHSAQARRLFQKFLKSLQTQIEQANQKLKALIAKEAPMAQRIQRLCSIKGVGFQTALSVSCLLAEIGSISTKQRAALVGVAPFVRDSALRCAKRSIRGGRAKLRSQLYRAALVGSRFNLILRDVYPRLIQRGKPKKVALVTLIRKLLIAMHYVLKKSSLLSS
jgi:transposase